MCLECVLDTSYCSTTDCSSDLLRGVLNILALASEEQTASIPTVGRMTILDLLRRGQTLPTTSNGDQHHILVIGAGVAGCVTAWELIARGFRVTIAADAFPSFPAAGQGVSGTCCGRS